MEISLWKQFEIGTGYSCSTVLKLTYSKIK